MSVMSARRRMLAGEVYNCLDPDLDVIRRRVSKLRWRHNRTESAALRRSILEEMLGRIGENSTIEPPFFCAYGENIYLGNDVFLNYQCTILDCNEVHIGDHVMVGPSVQLYTAAHTLEAATRIQGMEIAKPITIEANAWIGGGAIVLPGVNIGRNAVVGAGAVVSRDVPSDTVVVGNPARVIRHIEQ